MSRPMIREHNLETDEIIVREMDDDEFAHYEISQAAEIERKAEEDAKAATRQALLNKLGITEEEARLLLGGN